MTQAALLASHPIHNDPDCPFCEKKPAKPAKTAIGKDNSSSKLATSLTRAGDPIKQHLLVDSEHGDYSAEAHHAICGHEILQECTMMEQLLLKQGEKASKGADGYCEDNVGYNVNAAENGIWLPSVPEAYKVKKSAQPRVWWGDQTAWNRKNAGAPARTFLSPDRRDVIAYFVMAAKKRQFHKGPHGNVGTPLTNYVNFGKREVDEVAARIKAYSRVCLMDGEGSKARKKPPFKPPYGALAALNLVSRKLMDEVTGHPRDWRYFLSKYAVTCTAYWRTQG
jgi:hypothetical protein